MKVQIQIPDYLMVKHYKSLKQLHSLDEREQMIAVITALTGYESTEIVKWPITSVIHVYNELNKVISNAQPEFYPLVEWQGQLYGFSNMSKMSLGEYIDLDTLCKDTEGNINQILSLLYRPVTKNKVAGKYMIKSTVKAMKYDVENIFDYYQIEEYDPEVRKINADAFDDFPVEIALGAMSFFLGIEATLLKDSQTYSPLTVIETMMKEFKKNKQYQLQNTMAGFIASKNWATPPSYQSQVIKQ